MILLYKVVTVALFPPFLAWRVSKMIVQETRGLIEELKD